MLMECLIDAVLDSLKLLPFLFLTYLFMEWIEHAASERFNSRIASSHKAGPFIGAVLGIVPQCGFSGAAAALYATRVITLGTLVSIFLATSDEMLPVMISSAVPVVTIVKVIAIKVVCGMIVGFVLDMVLRKMGRDHIGFSPKHLHEGHAGHDIKEFCESEGCACDSACDHHHDKHAWGHIALSALKHSLQVLCFIFVITFIINVVIAIGFKDSWNIVGTNQTISCVLAAVIGLIPNCAVSVGLTELYVQGMLNGGAMIAGLLVNAGVGLLVLLRTNSNARENFRIIVFMIIVGILGGLAVDALGLL